ncbi:MAG: radical SAM protein [bacterium]
MMMRAPCRVHFFWLNENGPVGMSIGVSILSSEFRTAGHPVKVTHVCGKTGYAFSEERIARDVREFGADVFAVSFPSSEFPLAAKLIPLLRKHSPQAKIFCGGIHTMICPETVIEIPGVDGVCTGEADHIFLKLISAFERGDDWEETPGFWTRKKEKMRRNPPARPPDITHQHILNFVDIDYRTLVRHKSGFAEILLGRGCKFRCSFCQNHVLLNGRRKMYPDVPYTRARGIDNLLDEMRAFRQAVGPDLKGFVFGDDSIYYSRDWLDRFLDAYRREIGLPFIACLIANQVDRDLAVSLYNAGGNVIRIGIESNEKLRKQTLRKPISDKTLFRATELLHEAGLNVQGFGMYALPGETPADIMDLLSLAVALRIDVFRLSTYMPLPHTALERLCRKNDLIRQDACDCNFMTESALKWPPDTSFFHEKIRHGFPLIMNSMIAAPTGTIYKPVARRLLECSFNDWPEFLQRLPEFTKSLHADSISGNLPHYHPGIIERPDYAFLYSPHRKRKMLNIEDTLHKL